MNKEPLMDYRSVIQALKDAGTEVSLVCSGAENSSGSFSSVCVDSRVVQDGSLFVALQGEKTDGHKYLRAAFKQGASCAMVSCAGIKKAGIAPKNFFAGLEGRDGRALVIVDEVLPALHVLAAAYLDRFPGLVRVGITGSSGKTTTKEIAAAIIGCEKNVVTNEGNLNSEIGLPLSVFAVRRDHEIGIFEAGMNKAGEMAALASVLRPHLALITNVGPAHIGILGSMKAIAEEKKQIFSCFTGNETALIPEDDRFADFLSEGIKGAVVRWGRRGLETAGLGAIRGLGLEGTELVWEGIPAGFSLPGKHNVENALAAISLAIRLGLGGKAVRDGLAAVKPLFGRGEIITGKTTLVRDCYNANPASTAEAVAFCDELEWKGRRVYIMGAMLEQGSHSQEAHRDLGKLLASSKAGRVFLYGKETVPAAEVLEQSGFSFVYTDTMNELKKAAADFVRPGDLVLLKGSRGCALEELTGIVTLREAD
jgi:UDP-N-acetylmuramoyl-tripeptide--D-alanyl-D-alanine ligase